jgi:hypothetical protein
MKRLFRARNAFAILLSSVFVISCGADDTEDDIVNNSSPEGLCGEYSAAIGTADTWIETRSQLEDLHASECHRIRQSLRIYYIPGVTDLSLLENLTTVGGEIEIGYTEDLENLDGLQNIEDVRGVSLIQNTSLVDTSALQTPDHARNGNRFSLSVVYNDALETFEGLDGIVNVPYLTIAGNPKLRAIPGLDDVYSSADYDEFIRVRVERNPMLPQCKIDEFLSRVPDDKQIAVTSDNDESATCP